MLNAAPAPMNILCVMRMPPDLEGHGGSQRAWHLLTGLAKLGRVHFVLVFRDDDVDCMTTSLAPLEGIAASITRINIAGWGGTRGKQLKIFHPGIWDLARMRSHEAPLLSRAELQAISAQLPLHAPDVIFAGRLCSAVIVQALIDQHLLSAPRRVVDFDDIMSKFRIRQVRNAGATMGHQGRMLGRIDSVIIAQMEKRIARAWDGISVCTEEDARALAAAHPGTRVVKIPNAVHREALPARPADGRFKVLFAGNLGFPPNQEGLRVFLDQAWPAVRAAVPGAELNVVGMNPSLQVRAWALAAGATLHANVPVMRPYYEDCDAVIAPILFGSGTRIKILEAMAFGRAVVSTSLGAEGMDLQDGRHLLLADTMAHFAAMLVRLARQPALRARLVAAARAFQQRSYGPPVIESGVADLMVGAQAVAAVA